MEVGVSDIGDIMQVDEANKGFEKSHPDKVLVEEPVGHSLLELAQTEAQRGENKDFMSAMRAPDPKTVVERAEKGPSWMLDVLEGVKVLKYLEFPVEWKRVDVDLERLVVFGDEVIAKPHCRAGAVTEFGDQLVLVFAMFDDLAETSGIECLWIIGWKRFLLDLVRRVIQLEPLCWEFERSGGDRLRIF